MTIRPAIAADTDAVWRIFRAVIAGGDIGRGSHVANASFMVDPSAQGKGAGRAMGEHCLEEARRAAFRHATLGDVDAYVMHRFL